LFSFYVSWFILIAVLSSKSLKRQLSRSSLPFISRIYWFHDRQDNQRSRKEKRDNLFYSVSSLNIFSEKNSLLDSLSAKKTSLVKVNEPETQLLLTNRSPHEHDALPQSFLPRDLYSSEDAQIFSCKTKMGRLTFWIMTKTICEWK
jgi:hypothetical protein